jgi:hypothetical protein
MPRRKKEAMLTTMKLPESTRRIATLVGEGDRTAGVERLFAQLPTFYRVKLMLEAMADDPKVPAKWRRLIEAELPELEELAIERIYEEAVAEGVIVVQNRDNESTAWVV